MNTPKTSPELRALIAKTMKEAAGMSEEEHRRMIRKQRDGYAKAEASWPKPNFKMIDGVKVYESYEDYCNG